MPIAVPIPRTKPSNLVLCADGGGSKVCVVIRTSDGIEARATAGPCNVRVTGYPRAASAILQATYEALSWLPVGYLPANLDLSSKERPPLPSGLFRHCWLGLAGINTEEDIETFTPFVTDKLGVQAERLTISNDVNLLASSMIASPNIKHVLAVVAGTGTIGRTIRIDQSATDIKSTWRDVGVSRGWGYMLCDEGSAFWLGRLAIRSLLLTADRIYSREIYSSDAHEMIPLHTELMTYFGVNNVMDLIGMMEIGGLSGSLVEATAGRNAKVAGAARTVLRWAFDEDATNSPSQSEALRIVKLSVQPLVDLTMDLLGDGTLVHPYESGLALGGGLMSSVGYRGLLLDGLSSKGVEFDQVVVVNDAAGDGARSLARIKFGGI